MSTIRLLVGVDGVVKLAEVSQSSGHVRLDAVAKKMLAACTYHWVGGGFVTEGWIEISYPWLLTDADKNYGFEPAMVLRRSCVPPAYPTASVRAHEDGTTTLKLLIGVDGHVKDGTIFASSGHSKLDRAALDGLLKCGFKPATRNREAVEEWTELRYVWKLN